MTNKPETEISGNEVIQLIDSMNYAVVESLLQSTITSEESKANHNFNVGQYKALLDLRARVLDLVNHAEYGDFND